MKMEFLRRLGRSLFGYRSGVYRFAARAITTVEIIRREGVGTLRLLRKVDASEYPELTLKLRSLLFPFRVRPSTDDLAALVNNAIREEYGQLSKSFSPRVVVDAGAYIGDTAAYFLTRFSDATVIALEPSSDSYRCAEHNLKPYGARSVLLRVALLGHAGQVGVVGEQTGANITQDGSGVESVTIPSLMERLDLSFIDLLKLDIEGAELEVLMEGSELWLHKVGVILLETHGDAIEKQLIPLIHAHNFQIRRFRNVWYCASKQHSRYL